MKYAFGITALMCVCTTLILANGGFHSWNYNQLVDGIQYKRIRTERVKDEPEVLLSIGQLAQNVEIDGLIYQGWLHRRDDGTVRGGLLAEKAVVNGVSIPAETWVSFNQKGQLRSCAFPANQTIQKHRCRGTGGGSKGAVVVFYPNGKLKEFFAPGNVVIQNIPCTGGLFHSIQLHENGRLKSCTLSEAAMIGSTAFRSGERIKLDVNGRLMR